MLIVSIVIAGGVSWFASQHPDGLERVAENHGFDDRARGPLFSLLPDYTIPGVGGFLSNGLAGIIGVMATFGVVMLIGKITALRRKRRGESTAPRSH